MKVCIVVLFHNLNMSDMGSVIIKTVKLSSHSVITSKTGSNTIFNIMKLL